MKSYSLMLLFLVVCCSLASSEDTVSITGLHDDTFWLNPFDRLSNVSAFRKLESQEDNLTFFHPDDLKLLHSRWNKNQNIIPELQTSKSRPITKFVEELFPSFKFTTPRSAKKPNQPLVSSKKKRSGSRKTIEGNGSKEKIQSPKPFWGPSILIPSVRPWFYTTQAARKPPFKSSLPSNMDITREHTTPDYDTHAIDGPTRKSGVGMPLETREPSFPFWGLPIETSSTRPPLANTKITTAAIPSRTEEEFLFRLANETVDGEDISGPIALPLQQAYDLPYNPPVATERFRDQIHLKPGPPYQDKQEGNDFIEQNVWHATSAVTEPTIVGNPISTEPRSPQQQLEPDLTIQQQHYPGLAPNLEDSFLPKEIDTAALGSYPASYPHSVKHQKPHIIYHHQPAPQHNNYYHPPSRLTHIDFSPIFLAIVPIALFLGAAAAFALASAVSSSSAVATAQQQQQQQEESSNNNNNDNNNSNNNINTILALLAAFHEVKKHHDDHHKIVIVTTTTAVPPPADNADVANEVPVTTDPPIPPPPPTGPFFIKLSSSTTESPPAPLQSYGHYERKKVTYHHMNGIT